METSRPLAIALGAVLAVAAGSASRAGEPVDPNLNDHVLGTVGGLRYASDSGFYDPGSGYGDATAGCGGPRWHLLGGGAASGGSPPQAWLAADRPDDYVDADTQPDDGFLVGGYGPAGDGITGYSICIRDGELRYRMETIADQPSGLRSGSVMCGPPRWHVTSGSVFIATSESWAGSSFPIDGGDGGPTPDDGWAGTAYDTVGGIGGFSMYAVCAAGLDARYVQGASGPVAPARAAVRKARCGPDAHVVGGGVQVSVAADGVRLVSSAPFDGHDADAIPDDGWTTRVYNVAVSDILVTPYAICLS